MEQLPVSSICAYTYLATFLQLSHFTPLMCMGNVRFHYILLRTNEALLDLILGLSGCLDFLVSAFTFVITSLGNLSFSQQPILQLTIALKLPPSTGRFYSGRCRNPVLCMVQVLCPHPRCLKVSEHNMRISSSTCQQYIKKATDAPALIKCILLHSFFFLILLSVVYNCFLRTLYLLWGMNSA